MNVPDVVEDRVIVSPLVKVVLPDAVHEIPFADLALGYDDPATIGDTDLLERVARHLDQPVDTFQGFVIGRPTTGNVLVSPKPEFGG